MAAPGTAARARRTDSGTGHSSPAVKSPDEHNLAPCLPVLEKKSDIRNTGLVIGPPSAYAVAVRELPTTGRLNNFE